MWPPCSTRAAIRNGARACSSECPGMSWQNASAAAIAPDLEKLSHDELAPGLVGYRDGRAIGWVGLAPRADYGRLAKAEVLKPRSTTSRCGRSSASSYRAAHAAQECRPRAAQAAIDYAREHGATMLEAYPGVQRAWPRPGRGCIPRHSVDVRDGPASRSWKCGSGTRRAPSGRSCGSSSRLSGGAGRRRSGRASSP